MSKILLAMLLTVVASATAFAQRPLYSTEYGRIRHRLARGWNTWNTNSLLSHVRLPQGFAVNLGLKRVSRSSEAYLKEVMIGRPRPDSEQVTPGLHAYDGSYTELTVEWQGIKVRVQSATDGEDLVLLVTPLTSPQFPPLLLVEPAILWNRPRTISRSGDAIRAKFGAKEISVHGTKPSVFDPAIPSQTPYLAIILDTPIGISTGRVPKLPEIQSIVERNKTRHLESLKRYGRVFVPIQSVLAWNTIYDPRHDRVITTESRLWNQQRGGYAVWFWDTFFSAYAAAVDNKDLAYANVIEYLNENRSSEFVISLSQGNGRQTLDRSQPPVGSIVIRDIYRKYREKWFLREVFDRLLSWNRWWPKRRLNRDGLLSWGSSPFDDPWRDPNVNNLTAAKFESGLDNSPMYDDVPFNKGTHLMELSDVGLNSLYVADCDALSEIAGYLGRTKEAAELNERAETFRKRLQQLWDEKRGIFLNRRTDTKQWSTRISPTNLYPLLAKAATKEQAERMVREHFLNPEEFWGEWVIPSTPRNDPAFKEQDYWRGRIWPPSNFLIYLGLKNYDFPDVQAELAKESEKLMLKEWDATGHVHENYNALTGESDEPNKEGLRYTASEPLHSWGVLLGLIPIIEKGQFWR